MIIECQNNLADKFNTKNSYVYNMRNPYNSSKNNELINRKKIMMKPKIIEVINTQ